MPPPSRQSLKRRVKEAAKAVARRAFEAGQRVGVDVLPRHFYSSVPDLPKLRRARGWRRPSSMAGVAGADVAGQLAFARACCPPDVRAAFVADDVYAAACRANGEPGYGRADAAFLYGYVRTHRPPRVVQVGAGVSTAVVLAAARAAGVGVEVVCVDPYPTPYLEAAHAAGRIRLVAEPAEDVALDTLTDLGDGGLLFVDSTHTVKPGSEVNRIVLEVLPRLRPGCRAHFHDIFFPYDYPRGLFVWNVFPMESTLLHAFLACNARYTLAASLSMLHYADPAALADLLPGGYQPAANDDGLFVGNGSDGEFATSAYLECVGAVPGTA